jgi:hypothetical protein
MAAGPANPDPARFERNTLAVAAESAKPGMRGGRVSKESLAIAACRARAGRLGAATFGKLQLVARNIVLVAGTITPPPRAGGGRSSGGTGPQSYRCTVRGEGEILDFTTAPLRR